ncbi:MAG: flavodoxin-dependent (E)-4-hydroxy-3-methylbut-2-enyl-diphosphate synthase [Actinobacteria bacterium]|nr:flavodoxin-dependent (E)-4-hydroxy-3-methylbut-2-enyl-diphosphate synthase [Actinomycetota bacterium]
MQIIRRNTYEITVGKIRIGGNNPVIVQSMIKSRSGATELIIDEINDLQDAGCEIIRIAVPNRQSAAALKSMIKNKVFKVPVIADVHFDPDLAIEAIEGGADCVRVNPGNMGGIQRLAGIALKAKEKKSALRIGVNSGSLDKKIVKSNSGNIIDSMVFSALEAVALFEKLEFKNFKISAKASSVIDTVSVYESLSSKTRYPLHLGITEAGPLFTGAIKSAVGIGILLSKGIGDTLRVSLTDSSVNEVKAAYTILSSLGLRHYGINIVSCPTCGRTRVDLAKVVSYIEKITASLNKSLKIAVMGCIVNGPGEAKDADIGIAYGIKKAALFIKGKVIKRVNIDVVLKEFEKELQNML